MLNFSTILDNRKRLLNDYHQLKMTITLYYMGESPPCNVVLITLDLLKISYEKKVIDLSKGEHLTGDLVKVIGIE